MDRPSRTQEGPIRCFAGYTRRRDPPQVVNETQGEAYECPPALKRVGHGLQNGASPLEVLEKNGLVERLGRYYGAVYAPSEILQKNWDLLMEVARYLGHDLLDS